jgi:hypothetical protein
LDFEQPGEDHDDVLEGMDSTGRESLNEARLTEEQAEELR